MRQTISVFFLLVCFTPAFAQKDSVSVKLSLIVPESIDSAVETTKYPQRDLADVFNQLLYKKKDSLSNRVIKPVKYNFSIVPAIGYTLSTGVAGILATNVAFFTDDPGRTNVSNVAVQLVYSAKNQLTIPIIANIWTRDNQFNFTLDWRYYKYPQDTYGLGGHSSLENADLLDYQHLRLHQSVLKKIASNVYVGVGYFFDYHWDIDQDGQSNGGVSDADRYGLPQKTISSGPVLNFLYDNRKNAINPQNGFYANIEYRSNLTQLGSDENWQSLTVDVRKYVHFPAGSQNILAFWSYDWLTPSGNPPYLDLPATGWDTYNNTGRGYIQGRFRSKNMVYLESEYRFGLTRNGLFGAVLFANAQSFSNFPDDRFDKVWPGFGGGLRVKVNKHSNTNIAIDYGIGIDGSKGFFVNLGELF